MRIVCDFDGTITLKDTTDAVLGALADPAWEAVEADWRTGRISAARCMRRQIALLRADDAAVDAVLDAQVLDPGFTAFVAWCEARGLPVCIVSDGVDYFIRRILARHGLERLPVVSNVLAGAAPRRTLRQPWRREGCAAGSGVCKCAAAAADDRRLVFIGDGRSDFCLSGRADILFAKGELAAYAAGRDRPFHPFETFHDVTASLEALLAASPRRAAV
jgi:2-hydroxy-3-keto-5-methylthiopentenyl-1-phosphate phosphatase